MVMKRRILIFLLLFGTFNVPAQNYTDFTVSIPQTDPYQKRCYPVKSGSNFQMEVNVKNNIDANCKVSIYKMCSFVALDYWFSLNNSPISIKKDQTATFKLGVNVPYNIPDRQYIFNACIEGDKNGTTFLSSSLNKFEIIVDNTPPTNLSLTPISNTPNSVTLGFEAWDEMSNNYSVVNNTVGRRGIKQFVIAIKDQNGATVATATCNGTESSWIKAVSSNSLQPNTTYTAYLTATDLAGNSATSAGVQVKTAIAPPANIKAGNTTAVSTVLSWSAINGATAYKVYDVTSGTPVWIATTSSLQQEITNLKMGTLYKFAVSTVSGSEESGKSSPFSVTTAIPKIVGNLTVCNSDIYSIENLPPNSTLQWICENNFLNLAIGQGTPNATFTKKENGKEIIKATINYDGNVFTITKKVNVGTPPIEGIIINNTDYNLYHVCSDCMGNFIDFEDSENNIYNKFEGYLLSWPSLSVLQYSKMFYMGNFPFGYLPQGMYVLKIRGFNDCGVSDWYETEVESSPCANQGSFMKYTIYPNPANTIATLKVTEDGNNKVNYSSTTNKTTKEEITIKTITITDIMGNVVRRQKYMPNTKETQIKVSGLKHGIYLVIVNENTPQQQTLKLAVE